VHFPWQGNDRLTQGERGEVQVESNPETLPDSTDPSGPCPRCGRVSNFIVEGTVGVSFGRAWSQGPNGEREWDTLDRMALLRCLGCQQNTVVIEEQWIGDYPARTGASDRGLITYRGIHWWPPPGAADLDEAIPGPVQGGYAEAVRALSVRAPRAAATMLRGTLEALVRDRGSDEAQQALATNLARALRVMADEHTLDGSLADWAAEIRLAGNAGAHLDPLEGVTMDEAEDLAHLTRQLLHYVYELPAQLRRARG